MKIVSPLLLAFLLLRAAPSAGSPTDSFQYVSPCPGAKLVARETTIILRPAGRRADSVASAPSIDVRGSISGIHRGEWIAAEQGRTFIFRPYEPFVAGENIAVTGGLSDRTSDDFSFDFTISPKTTDLRRGRVRECEGYARDPAPSTPPSRPAPQTRTGLVLPEFFPTLTVTVSDNPTPGYLFVTPRLASSHDPPHYAAMLDNTGSPAFFRELPVRVSDFKKHPSSGLYTYFQGNGFHVTDASFNFQGFYSPGNGHLLIDGHDFQFLPNGNAFVAIQDWQTVDMSVVVPGGNPNATVVGFVMQEQDLAHNVVFQWRSWDHFQITDAVGLDLTRPWIDYVHFNSFHPDTDGNILVSCREMNEVTKINRTTGAVMWRFSQNQNEFTLVDDTVWIERQHSVRRTPTGTITIFDNGQMSAPFESRAVEYDIDEVNKIATKVWEFRDDPPRFAAHGSSVQRLANGNTLIDWVPVGIVTEVRSDGTKALELVFDQHWSYRAFRFDWSGASSRPELWHYATPLEVTLHFAKFGDPDVAGFNIYRGSTAAPTTQVGSTPSNSFVLSVLPSESLYVRVTAEDSTGTESPYSNELHIVVPDAVDTPSVGGSPARIALHQNRPNPFTPYTSIPFTLPQRGLVDLSVYDVRGGLVRRLTHDVMRTGLNEVIWDGTDARGREIGSGVYFYRLKTEDREITRRMVLLR